jgi:outer membrane protein assembly factor BamB
VKVSKISVVLLALIYLITSIVPVFGAAYKFALDDQNTRQIKDSFTETGFPFQEDWSVDLGGQVMSQPIVADGYIYVQAGKDLVKISLEEKTIVDRIKVTDHELPSGSSPTYALTTHGPRIYQATRDHKLIAIDVNTFKPIWELILTTDENSDNYKKRYRVTASPLVYIHNNRTYLAIGTANGDGTGLSEQHADNGFFIIHDTGVRGKVIKSTQMDGEVTGSPIIHNGMIIGTENTQYKESWLIRYIMNKDNFTTLDCPVDLGVPGSPAAEGDYIYVVDRTGCLYKFENKSETEIQKIWVNPEKTGDFDATRPLNSYNLLSPAIGNKYIYIPIQHYNSASFNGPGAVIAVDKESGHTHRIHTFSTMLKSNLLYWKPCPTEYQDYVFAFDYDGNAWALDGQTLEPVEWFYDKETKQRLSAVKLFPVTGSSAPEMVIADSYLLITDGQGILHAYKADNPVNFQAVSLAPKENKEYETGEMMELCFTVKNTSGKDYANIPVELLTPEGETIPGGKINLAAGEEKTLYWGVEVPPEGQAIYQAVINPEGHPEEIKEEITPRLDNTAVYELHKNSYDLEIVSFEVPSHTTAGKIESINTTVKNNSLLEIPDVLIQWKADTTIIHEQSLSFLPGESKPLTFTWRAPDKEVFVNLSVTVNPLQTIEEENFANNYQYKFIDVQKYIARSCQNKLEEASWDVTYPIIAGYHTKQKAYDIYDDEGNKIGTGYRTVTDYKNPKWKDVTVTYHESLSAKVSVDTKQGIPTDPKNPKESDRESRGSWSIIPYAQEHGLNPNEITKAGYGFEVSVETTYQNDWETKVPDGLEDTAHPIGGSFSGPTAVIAEFYDTNNHFVKEIAMERISGTSGKGKAIWALPELPPYRLKNGEFIIGERKHYTDENVKDGNYLVRIRVEDAGRNNLYTCLTKTVLIHGSMYDDIYTTPVPRDR